MSTTSADWNGSRPSRSLACNESQKHPAPHTAPASSRRFSLVRKSSSSWPLPPESPPSTPLSSRSAGRLRRSKTLEVLVHVRFDAPIRDEYRRTYAASASFEPTDKVCESLLRRLEHGTRELVTRKDSSALLADPSTGQGRTAKPRRFHISFSIFTGGLLWAETECQSFQEKPLTPEAAREVALATDRMVGVFLLRHDDRFRWTNGAVREYFTPRPVTHPPCLGRAQSLSCIPRLRFIESNQSFEFVPGYEIELDFQSRAPGWRMPSQWGKTIVVRSTRAAPLNLRLGEALLWKVGRLVDQAVDGVRAAFDDMHGRSCDGLDGPGGCSHFADDAVELTLRIKNNLGPDYDHLCRRLQTKQVLFRDADAGDVLDMARQLDDVLVRARDETDAVVGALDDFVLRIVELGTPAWSVENPLVVSLDSATSYSHRSIEAILDRVQTGICDVLRGNDIDITMVAHKRGHLVLDKIIRAHAREDVLPANAASRAPPPPPPPPVSRDEMLGRLRRRIIADMYMVCQDTISLDGRPSDKLENLHIRDGNGNAIDLDGRPVVPERPVPVKTTEPVEEAEATVVGDDDEDGEAIVGLAESAPEQPVPVKAAEPIEEVEATVVGDDDGDGEGIVGLAESAPSPVEAAVVGDDEDDGAIAGPAESTPKQPVPVDEADATVVGDYDEDDEAIVGLAESIPSPALCDFQSHRSILAEDRSPSLAPISEDDEIPSTPSTPSLSYSETASPEDSMIVTPSSLLFPEQQHHLVNIGRVYGEGEEGEEEEICKEFHLPHPISAVPTVVSGAGLPGELPDETENIDSLGKSNSMALVLRGSGSLFFGLSLGFPGPESSEGGYLAIGTDSPKKDCYSILAKDTDRFEAASVCSSASTAVSRPGTSSSSRSVYSAPSLALIAGARPQTPILQNRRSLNCLLMMCQGSKGPLVGRVTGVGLSAYRTAFEGPIGQRPPARSDS